MKKQVLIGSIVFGIIITAVLILVTFLIPVIGIPLIILFIVIWPIATIMRMNGIKNIHLFGGKFIGKD